MRREVNAITQVGIGILVRVMTLLVAVVMIVIGTIFFVKFDPDAYDTKGIGKIVEIEEHYESIGGDNELQHTVYIDYQAGKERYQHVAYPAYNSKMQIGDTVEFYYMSDDPTSMVTGNKNLVPYIGLAFAVIGLIMVLVPVARFILRRL